jgi:hypothetical protein
VDRIALRDPVFDFVEFAGATEREQLKQLIVFSTRGRWTRGRLLNHAGYVLSLSQAVPRRFAPLLE